MAGKCFFIATSWGAGVVPSHFKALGNFLCSKGHRVIFLTDGQRQDIVSPETNPAIYTWPSRRPVHWKDAVFLYRLIRSLGPDYLLAQFGATNIMMLVGYLCGVPVRIAWYHTMGKAIKLDWKDSTLKLKFLDYRKRFIYQLATHLVAVSEAAKRDLIARFNINPDKCLVFYNSMPDHCQEINIKNIERLILCVGRLDPTKGQDILIRAGALVKEKFSSVPIKFIGDGPLKPNLLRLVTEEGIGENCQFLGLLPWREVLAHTAAAYVAVVPSRSEAFPSVAIEPISFGVPVIASRVGGIPEIIRDGIDGFLVPPDDPAALAEKLIYPLENPRVREEMGRNARERFLSTFEQQKVITQQVAWLESLLN